ncbi:aromatic amino acid transaminase [Sessilibacter corallicola]|uniref:amino acid aminotransferase n=1 Tax=Sessilibacter corallicola TaxID=2904075 RepID=UPI001E3B6286|nr:amino acid aminotransferase [Sessilibacter corallicola]MCE2028915.1 aspartate/tyrosine/aromatic aminotransferase [Sessilibacter corallicola]
MFETLPTLVPDPILGLVAECKRDNNPNKIDLSVGVYKDESNHTPVMAAVREAQIRYLESETSKVYQPPGGTENFIGKVNELIFGESHPALKDNRIATVQATGGCASLHLAAKLIMRANPDAKVWLSDPSWPNHFPLLSSTGINIELYPYYDSESHSVSFDKMVSTLENAGAGDLVLIHASCHNPCGADLTKEQWRILTELAQKNGFVPFIDMAYQGFGLSLDDDAYGIRYMSEHLPEVVVCNSFSKNFGLYRERAGSLSVVVSDAQQTSTVMNQALNVARGIYSMPPAHGAALVETVLSNPDLRDMWHSEVNAMRERIVAMRSALADGIAALGCDRDFSFIKQQFGMFSFLGLTETQVDRLKTDYSVYIIKSSRISVAGINPGNLPYLCRAVSEVVKL